VINKAVGWALAALRASKVRRRRMQEVHGPFRGSTCVRAPSHSRPEEALGGLCQGTLRRTGSGTRVSVALHPSRRNLEPAVDRVRPKRRQLPGTKTINATVSSGIRYAAQPICGSRSHLKLAASAVWCLPAIASFAPNLRLLDIRRRFRSRIEEVSSLRRGKVGVRKASRL
jgi:hypothetical protein